MEQSVIVLAGLVFLGLLIIGILQNNSNSNKLEEIEANNSQFMGEIQLALADLKDKLVTIESKASHNHKAEVAHLIAISEDIEEQVKFAENISGLLCDVHKHTKHIRIRNEKGQYEKEA